MSRVEVIGDATLYCGDCREILPTLPRVDAVVTDPPYGIGENYHSYCDDDDALRELAKEWLPLAQKVADRVVFTPGNVNTHKYPPPTWTLAWVTPGAGGSSGPWGFSMWQPVMCYGPDPFLAAGKGRRPDTIIHSEAIQEDYFNNHPCPKPVGFVEKLVARAALPDHTILDPFMGSGTTGVACMKLGRRFIGIEIEPRYFDIACRRIEEAWKQPRLFEEPRPKIEQTKLDL